MPPKKRFKTDSSKPGTARSHLEAHFSSLPDDASLLKNGHILHIYESSGSSRSQTIRVLQSRFPATDFPSVLDSRIKSLVSKTLNKFRCLKSNPKELLTFATICSEAFNISVLTADIPEPEVQVTHGIAADDVDVEAVEGIPPPMPVTSTPAPAVTTPVEPMPSTSGSQTRYSSEVLTPRKHRMRQRLQFVSASKAQLAKKYTSKISDLKGQLKCPKCVINQALKRKNEHLMAKDTKIKVLQAKLAGHELTKELAATKAKLAQLKQAHSKLKKYNSGKKKKKAKAGVSLHQHKKVQRKLEAEKEDLQVQLQEEIEKPSEVILCKKDGKTFNSNYRRCVYSCLVNQVPVEAAGHLIHSIVEEMTGQKLDSVADPSTVSQCAYELGILADIQVAESLELEDNVNIAWDATSLDAKHVNEIHINCSGVNGGPPRSLVLQVEILTGGTTADYVQHICQALKDITTTYAEFKQIDHVHFHHSVINKLKSTLSDRVNVNHCVRVKLEEDLDCVLLELKYNVHPLDGLASEARKCFKSLDKESNFHGSVLGQETAAVNVIYGLSKMHYKYGTGDPKGLKHFMKTNDIKGSMMTRYVGNRMHVLFHLGGTFYFLREKLLSYLQKSCNCQTGFRTSLLKDLSSPYLQMQLKALGLVGKLLTGPWMVVLYSNKEVLSNLEAVPLLKSCVEKLMALSGNPASR